MNLPFLLKHQTNRASMTLPTAQLLIVSYYKDADWCFYNLKSITKYCRGFLRPVLAIPTRDAEVFKPHLDVCDVKLMTYDEIEGKGMLQHMIKICRADELCEGDIVVCSDSDCHFWNYVTPETYFYQGKPCIFRVPYSYLEGTPNFRWKAAAERALGFEVSYETMMRHPLTYKRDMFPGFRAYVEKFTERPFDEYVLAQENSFPQGFAEHSTLGAYNLKFHSDEYSLFDYIKTPDGTATWYPPVPEDYVGVFWSHGGMSESQRAYLEKVTSAEYEPEVGGKQEKLSDTPSFYEPQEGDPDAL